MAPAPRLELVIRLTAEGHVQIAGSLDDQLACYGMLECARDLLKEHFDKKRRSAIIQARPADPMLINPRRNGDATGG